MGQVWIQFWILVEWGGGKRPETLFTGHLPIPTQQKVEVSETPLQNTKSPQDTFWNPSFNTNAHNTNGHSKLLARNNASQWGYPREIGCVCECRCVCVRVGDVFRAMCRWYLYMCRGVCVCIGVCMYTDVCVGKGGAYVKTFMRVCVCVLRGICE